MRTYLNVPFSEKEIAKDMGAKWCRVEKKWYIENVPDFRPYLRWIDNFPEISKQILDVLDNKKLSKKTKPFKKKK